MLQKKKQKTNYLKQNLKQKQNLRKKIVVCIKDNELISFRYKGNFRCSSNQ